MDGGCLSLWPGRVLTAEDKELFNKYSNYISDKFPILNLRIQPLNISDSYIQKQTITLFGFLPNEEFIVCGWADDIFNASEAILREFGGYFTSGTGATKEQFKQLPGSWKKLRKRYKYFPLLIYEYKIIIDWEFMKNYFNATTTDESRQYFSIERFKKLEEIKINPN